MKYLATLLALSLAACGGGGGSAGSSPASNLLPSSNKAAGTSLSTNPSSAAVANGQTSTIAISGGTPPYTLVQNCPRSGATAALSGSTLTVTGQTNYAISCSEIVNDSAGATVSVCVETLGVGEAPYPCH